jgi:hypothetical protein
VVPNDAIEVPALKHMSQPDGQAIRIKMEMKAGGTPKCPMPGCPFHEDIESAMKAAKSEAQPHAA